MEVDITSQIIGGSYQHKSKDLNSKRAINFWPQLQEDPESKTQYALETFPGLTSFASQSGANRGVFDHLGTLYHVVDTTLYSVDSAGTHTAISGTIAGAERCTFASIGGSLLIATGGVAYEYDGSTLTTGTDADFETPNTVTGINNQAIYDGDSGRFGTSNVGDYLNINSLKYATAESDGDNLLRPYAFKEQVKMFGEKTIETWWNTGTGNPPFSRVQGAIHQVGLGAVHSVSNNDNFIYFLGDDNHIYRLEGNREVPVSHKPLNRIITNFATVSDAVGWCMNYQGSEFYTITFPTADRTFCFQEGGEWFELSTGLAGGRYSGEGYSYTYRKHLIADANGNIFELDEDNYTENSAVIQRTIDSSPIHSGIFTAPGKLLDMNSLTIIMETGVGIASGQGSEPRLMVSWSDDGGKNFSTEVWEDIGELGKTVQVKIDSLGSFDDARILRLRVTDPVHMSIHRVMADLEVGI